VRRVIVLEAWKGRLGRAKTPATNLQPTLLDGAGVPLDQFGDSTGRLNLRRYLN